MRAMILAAGLGNRMQPLTASTPKPLLQVAGKSLIEHQIEKLVAVGITDLVINHFYRGAQIVEALGNGSRYGASITYSKETIRLETAGGIIKSLPHLKDDSFVVVNSDIWCDYPLDQLKPLDGSGSLAHLVLIENAAHKPQGDFSLDEQGTVSAMQSRDDSLVKYTFSGISVMHKKLFAAYPIKPLPLRPVLEAAMARNRVSGELYKGVWMDIGTPQRLQQLDELIRDQNNGQERL